MALGVAPEFFESALYCAQIVDGLTNFIKNSLQLFMLSIGRILFH